MKVVSSCISLYGSDYIGYAFKSMDAFVDEHHLWYTSQPTYGQTTRLPNPDRQEHVMAAVRAANLQKPMHVHIGHYPQECAHRQDMQAYCNAGDIVVICDADEVWNQEMLPREIEFFRNAGPHGEPPAEMTVRMVHFWRSFNWACSDGQMQKRMHRIGYRNNMVYTPLSRVPDLPDIYHFGYARSIEDTRYKMAVSAHVPEFRQEWWDKIFLANDRESPLGVHPVCLDFWRPWRFDRSKLPSFMHEHPYFQVDVIE